MKKQEIFQAIFNSKWNSTGTQDKKIIYLFIVKGGFEGLYNFIISEKARMKRDFSVYYSEDLEETLETAKESLNDEDFEKYILTSHLDFHKGNYLKLKEIGLLKYFGDFDANFRGQVKQLHQIGDYKILESERRDEGSRFYVLGDFTTCYLKLEEALLATVFKGKYFSALCALFESSRG